MDDAAFLDALQRGSLPGEEMDHRAHLRLALLCRDDPRRAREILLSYVTRLGVSVKYHETLTQVWLRLVAACPARTLDGLMKTHLADKDLPLRHYSPERLWSEEARSRFVEPDLLPLP